MARTADEWLPILAKRLDDRRPKIEKDRKYAAGDGPLPEMGKNLKASWERFQRKAMRNLGGLAIASLGDRIVPNGCRVGEDDKSEASARLRTLWRDNRLDVAFDDAIDDYLTTGWGYLVVGLDAVGEAILTRERPEQFIAAADPARPWKAQAALKVWRDIDAKVDYAQVYVAGAWKRWKRPTRPQVSTAWPTSDYGVEEWVSVAEGEYEGGPLVAVLERKEGKGLLDGHYNLIDGINLGKLNRLVVTAMQAFRQRALKQTPTKDGEPGKGLPDKDAEGNDVDYAKVFEPAPGAFWELPEGFDVWESEAVDIRPLLEGEKTDARDFAAELRTPISVFIPDSANQSAEGAAAAKESQVAQARKEIKRLQPGIAVSLVYLLQAAGVDLSDQTVQILWTPPEHVSMSEKYAAAAQAKAAGMSMRSIMRDILGMTPDQISQEEIDRAEEQLAALSLVAASSDQAGTPVAAAA